jgi:hypothetical protein
VSSGPFFTSEAEESKLVFFVDAFEALAHWKQSK